MSLFLDNKTARVQLLLIAIIWLIILTLPLLFIQTWDEKSWERIYKLWQEYGIVFILFLLNRFIFLPKLFFTGKKLLYILVMFAIALSFSAILFITDSKYDIMKGKVPQPHHMEETGMPHPYKQGRRPQPMHVEPLPHQLPAGNDSTPPFANIFIISILLLGFDTGLIFYSKWIESEKIKLKIEKESIENKMAFLQNQISPHFFMNTLNNIHALIDISGEEAKGAVIRLSQIMGYMIYDSQTDKILLQHEIDFIRSYVELMKLRFTDDIQINLSIPNVVPQINVPPLLTISFIENAFKHGVSYEKKSFINISYEWSETNLLFNIANSNHPKTTHNSKSGIGLDNTQKRLDLIYNNEYTLNINNTSKDKFEVNLKLPL